MNPIEQARLEPLYAAMLRALKLQGMAEKTIDALAAAPCAALPPISIAVVDKFLIGIFSGNTCTG